MSDEVETSTPATRGLLVGLAAALGACAAPTPHRAPAAQEAVQEARPPVVDPQHDWVLPPLVPQPDYMARKPDLPDLLLKDKREGSFFTGFPAIGYDDEKGAQVGAVLQWFDNGSWEDPYFRSTPYRGNVGIGAVGGSDNQELRLNADLPYVFDSPYRIRANMTWRRSDILRYFGVGESTLGPLTYPGAPGVSYESYNDYKDALEQVEDGRTWARYDEWRGEDVLTTVDVERDLAGGILRALVGLELRWVDVDDYTGDTVTGIDADGNEVPAIQEPTHLMEDHLAGRISGFEGGWDNYLKLGLTLDTRDFEPDPSTGLLGQVATELSTPLLASDYEYQRVTTSLAGYYSPFPEATRLILALRGQYTMQFGDVPFFALNTLAYNTVDRTGLGGFHSIRGYKTSRFVGDSSALFNAEVRWSPLEFFVGTQHLRLGAAAFYDTGRVFDDVGWSLDDWKHGRGAGLMLAWNLSTIIRFDYAESDEDAIFYVELGHSF